MKPGQELEKDVVASVKHFADSIYNPRKIVGDISYLTAATTTLKLVHLDCWERVIRDEFESVLGPTQGARWLKPKVRDRPLTWIDVFSRDGYKREKSLLTLTGPVPNSFFFALALRRLNDWVPEVRQAARERLPAIVESSDSTVIALALCATLPNWRSWGRMESEDRQALLSLLTSETTFSSVVSLIISSTSGPMTSILSQLGRSVEIDGYLSEIASKSIQPSVRAKAYRSQLEGSMKWLERREWEWTDKAYCKGWLKPIVSERELSKVPPFIETLRSASEDKSPAVRRVAAELLIGNMDSSGSIFRSYAVKFSADTSPSVAERGVYALQQFEADGERS